ncbi:MAG: M14 family zinc carboxypeptidase [Planctomycetaceae bacterium]
MRPSLLLGVMIAWLPGCDVSAMADALVVVADFEGASVTDVVIDQTARSIHFRPGGQPQRGWPCWWYFRIDGMTPGETLTLHLTAGDAGAQASPALAAVVREATAFSMPSQATWSADGHSWQHTAKGVRDTSGMTWMLSANSSSVFVAWGPPCTPTDAARFVQECSRRYSFATADVLCRSEADRPVPMLRIQEGVRPADQRFGIWCQARQHAWESGSSWVAQGFAEWALSDHPEAAWLRQHAEVFIVPIMDVDNVATGNGGKNAVPHDHNRDWSAQPVWKETLAAQRRVSDLIAEGRMDLFLDLHNPAPGDPSFFYILDRSELQEPMISLRDRFIDLAYQRISRIQPLIPMSNRPKTTGAAYHPLWRQISANWVSLNGNPQTVSVCLETIWNYQNSTTAGYRAVGGQLAAAAAAYLAERPSRVPPAE